MRARTTIWTGLALAACATLSLVLWKLDKDGREEAIESAFRLTEARVAVADARVSGAMGEVSQVLRSVEDYLRIRSLPQSLDDDDHLFLASRAADQAITTEVVVVSADGAIIGHSDLSKPPVIDVSDRDYFQALSTLANSRDLYIGRPVTSRTSGATVIPVARALYTEAGIFAGVVAAAVDPDDLLQVLPPTGDTVGTAVLAREDGIVLAREPANEQYLGSDTSSAPLFTTHIPASPRGSYVSISPLDNHHRLISYRHDADLGTVTLVTADRYAVLAPQATMRAAYVGIGVVGSGLILLLFTMLYRQTTRRQRAVDALVESRAELARLNEQLEARVLERTMDLQHSEARSRAFLEAAHDAVIVIDQDDRILEFNPAATRVFGYTAAEVERLTFSDLVPVYDPDAPEDAPGPPCRRYMLSCRVLAWRA